MSITDMIISAIIKKGILYESKNCNVEFEIPTNNKLNNKEVHNVTKISFKAENITLRIENKKES